MEQLRIYRISDKYVNFLSKVDSRVQYNKNKRRPYVGIVLYVGEYRYFVPMESPKPAHAKIKSGQHIMRLDGGALGLLGFNNMIPVPDSALICFDIDAEPDHDYAELLRRQIFFINRNKSAIFSRASATYYKAAKGNNDFLNKICCNFKALERASSRYNPNYRPQKRPYTGRG